MKFLTYSILLLLSALGLHFLIVLGAFDGPFSNPLEQDDICFTQDRPGATSRYSEFTFISCSTRLPLHEPVGTDQAVLKFDDVDGDGRPEAIVESSRYKCKYGGLGCYGATRSVLKICPACPAKVTLIQEQRLPELERGLE